MVAFWTWWENSWWWIGHRRWSSNTSFQAAQPLVPELTLRARADYFDRDTNELLFGFSALMVSYALAVLLRQYLNLRNHLLPAIANQNTTSLSWPGFLNRLSAPPGRLAAG
jgi:hypothetical protein